VSATATVADTGLVLAPPSAGRPVPDVFDSVVGKENLFGQDASDRR
jgi:hypothetical protein